MGKTARYISPHRIISHTTTVDRIPQPRPPVSTVKEFFNQVSTINKVAVATGSTNTVSYPPATLDRPIRDSVIWLQNNNYTVIPEKTSHPGEQLEDIAVVVGYSGADQARYHANKQAMTRLLHANPRPKAFIFVEFVGPDEVSHYSNLENEGWDKVIVKQMTHKSDYIWQKEAMWSLGGKYAFNELGVNKCLFIDADIAYEDNSYAYHISNVLDTYEIIQGFEAIYYADQPDQTRFKYGQLGVNVSTAWAIKHNYKISSPGGCYACTAKFFKEQLGETWPISSRGSGDAIMWLCLKGIESSAGFPRSFDFRLNDKNGVLHSSPVGYVPLLILHYNHGPLFNRMFCSRDYMMRKCCSYPGSDIKMNEDGVYEWTNTHSGHLMKETVPVLIALNNQAAKQRRALSVDEIKEAMIVPRQTVYGTISENSPLYIVTYANKTISDATIRYMKSALEHNCSEMFIFLVFSNREIEGINTVIVDDLPALAGKDSWMRLAIFGYDFGEQTSVLFVDPSVEIKRKFVVTRCPGRHIYMAKPYMLSKQLCARNWDSNLMFFRNIHGLYERYKADIAQDAFHHPEYQFLDPSDYINAYAHFNNYKVGNIYAHFDYKYANQMTWSNASGAEWLISLGLGITAQP